MNTLSWSASVSVRSVGRQAAVAPSHKASLRRSRSTAAASLQLCPCSFPSSSSLQSHSLHTSAVRRQAAANTTSTVSGDIPSSSTSASTSTATSTSDTLAAASSSSSVSSTGSKPPKRTSDVEIFEGVPDEDELFSGFTPSTGKGLEDGGSTGEVNFSLARPPQLVPKHRHLVCKLVLSSNTSDLSSLTFYTQFCVHAAYAFGLASSLPGAIPVKTSLRTVPRSPFVHKPSQENFIKKTHSRYIKIYDGSPETVDRFLTYLTENGMGGVRMRAQTWERHPVGFGKGMVADASAAADGTEALGGEGATIEAKIKALADQLVKNGLGGVAVDADAEEEAVAKQEEKDSSMNGSKEKKE